MKGYPFSCPIQVRWRDLDANGHVNNAVFVTFLEVSRAELWHTYFSFDHVTEFPFLLARVEIDYRGTIHLEEEVVVGPLETEEPIERTEYGRAQNRGGSQP